MIPPPTGPLAPHRLMAKLGETPLPPPSDPPMADDAPERLVAFLYMVTRDLLPARYVEHLVSFIESDRKVSADPDLKAWAERMGRRLMYDDKRG